jgi:hypothetical protein
MATSQLYLLPCSCGEKIRVRTRNAGETVTCQCGARLQVPTIRGLRQLESIDDVEEVSAPTRSPLEGPFFSIGLLGMIGGLILVAVTLLWPLAATQIKVDEVGMSQADLNRSKVPVDEMGASDLYDEFIFLRDRARSDHFSYAQSLVDAALLSQKVRLTAGSIIAAIGAALLIAGIAIPILNRQSPRKD